MFSQARKTDLKSFEHQRFFSEATNYGGIKIQQIRDKKRDWQNKI